MYIKLQLPTSENKTQPKKFLNLRKYVVQHRKMVIMPQILHYSWLTSRNATPSIGSLYKLVSQARPLFFFFTLGRGMSTQCKKEKKRSGQQDYVQTTHTLCAIFIL